jgi:hypothetical protein
VYGLTRRRDRPTVERFLSAYVDPVSWGLGDRHERVTADGICIQFVPPAAQDPWTEYAELWVPDLAELVAQALARPDEGTLPIAFTARQPGDRSIATLVFTRDRQLVVGLSIDEDGFADVVDGVPDAVVQHELEAFLDGWDCHLAFAAWACPAPLDEREFREAWSDVRPELRRRRPA